jgi:WxL Interacting Protein, peptidoglycan binding domain
MISSAFSRQRRHFRRRGAATVAAALLALGAAAGPAVAAAGAGAPLGTFGINPAPNASGQASSYFSLTLGPGQSVAETAIVHNTGTATATLKVGPSVGTTATNSGTAYTGAFKACQGAACWISGLPATVTLAAHGTRPVTFTVRVPPGTTPGQYLAGVSVASAATPAPVAVGSNSKGAKAQAIILETVTAGVAVTVGSLSGLTWNLAIPAVTGTDVGTMARLNIAMRNTGQTFNHASGTAACTAAGKQHSYRVSGNEILPGESASIAVNAPGLPLANGVQCSVLLRDAKDKQVSWAGTINFASSPGQRLVHTGKNTYSVVPTSSGIPVWAWILGGLLVTGLLMGGAVIWLRLRRPSDTTGR